MRNVIRKLSAVLLVLTLVVCMSVTVFAQSFYYSGTYNTQGYMAEGTCGSTSFVAGIGSSSTYTLRVRGRNLYEVGEETKKTNWVYSERKATYTSVQGWLEGTTGAELDYYMEGNIVYSRTITAG